MSVTLYIKGNAVQAADAMTVHGVPGTIVTHVTGEAGARPLPLPGVPVRQITSPAAEPMCVTEAEAEDCFDKIAAWFKIPAERPFPDGTLLFFGTWNLKL